MSGVRDTDRGASALLKRLRDLDRKGAIKLSVGVHPDVGARPHPSGGTIGEVASYVELGTNHLAPAGMLRSTIDQQRVTLADRLVEAGANVLRGATIGEAFGPMVRTLVRDVKARTPVDTATVRDSIEGRIDGERVA